MLIEHGVYKVASIAMSALGNLLKRTKVVHPVEFGSLLNLIVASHEHIDLERCSSEGCCHLGSHVLGGLIDTWLVACSEFLQLQVSLHEVGERVALWLFPGTSQHLEFIEFDYLVFVVLESEDGSVHSSVRANNHPVFSCDSKSRVH